MHNFNFTPDMFGLTGHGMRLRTIRGYDFGEVSSAMQNAIRRGETQYAGRRVSNHADQQMFRRHHSSLLAARSGDLTHLALVPYWHHACYR